MNKYIDPSLARGLARGAVRETMRSVMDLRPSNELHRRGGTTSGRAAGYRLVLDLYRARSRNGLVREVQLGTGKGKKSDGHIFVVWDAMTNEKNLGLGLLWIRCRDMTRVEYAPLRVSAHACERIFQRLGTTDLPALYDELASVTLPAIRLWSMMIRPDVDAELTQAKGVLLPTENGTLIVSRDSATHTKPHLIATTWVNSDRLWEDQIQSLKAVGDGTLLRKSIADASPLVLPDDPWPETMLLMERYGQIRPA